MCSWLPLFLPGLGSAVHEPAAFITAAFWIGAVRVRVLNSAHVKTVAPEELKAEADRAAQHAACALFSPVHPGVARLSRAEQGVSSTREALNSTRLGKHVPA